MSRHNAGSVIPLPQGVDLTGAMPGAALTIQSDGQVELANAATDNIVGFLVTPAPVSRLDAAVDVIVSGWVDCVAGEAITAGHLIFGHTTDGRVSGKAASAIDAEEAALSGGVALTGATAAGDTVRVLVG